MSFKYLPALLWFTSGAWLAAMLSAVSHNDAATAAFMAVGSVGFATAGTWIYRQENSK